MKRYSLMAAAICCTATLMAETVTPLSVENLHGVWNDDNSVTLTFNAPTQGLNESLHLIELTEISQIVISRALLHQASTEMSTIYQPVPGQALTIHDIDVTKGEVYTYTVTTYSGSAHDGGASVTVSNYQYPSPVTEARATSAEGKSPVTITFRAPAVDTEGRALASLSKIVVKKYDTNWNEVTVKSLSRPTPGEVYEVTDSKATEGRIEYYYITPYTSDGSGYAATAYCLVGEDTPNAADYFTAEATGEGINLSWEPSSIGSSYGWVDLASLTYSITRTRVNGTEETIAEGLTELTFTDDSRILSDPESFYTYQLYCSNHLGSSLPASAVVLVGQPAELPWKEEFDRAMYSSSTFDSYSWTRDPQWVTNVSAYDINSGATIYPHSGRGLAYVAYNCNSVQPMRQTLTSGHIDMSQVSNAELKLSYYAMTGGFDNEIAIEASADDQDYVTLATYDYKDATADGWQEATIELKPMLPASTLRIRVVAVKGAHSTLAAIDALSLEATETGIHAISDDARNSSACYNLLGQPVKGNTHGMTIENGRPKIVIPCF